MLYKRDWIAVLLRQEEEKLQRMGAAFERLLKVVSLLRDGFSCCRLSLLTNVNKGCDLCKRHSCVQLCIVKFTSIHTYSTCIWYCFLMRRTKKGSKFAKLWMFGCQNRWKVWRYQQQLETKIKTWKGNINVKQYVKTCCYTHIVCMSVGQQLIQIDL